MDARPPMTQPYVFVSYASADRERVMTVVAALQHAGVPVWLDQQGIAGGENYGREITGAIKGCAALVLMASAAALASRNVAQEVALAWRFERPYLPLLLEAVTIPDELAYWLEAAQWIELLDKQEAAWLPAMLTALEPLGIAPKPAEQEEVRLAGRERELGLLREHLASAVAGRGSLVLIGGEAGIGKTTLAEAVCAEAARRGAVVLTGRCFDLAETPPYGPWLYLFERYPSSATLPPLPTAFAEPGRVGEVASQAALFRQVLDFLKSVAAVRPLVVLLDDYHWADPASLDLLRFLAQSLATLPVLLLVTYRSDELTRRHALYALLPLLVREAGAERLDVHHLDDNAVQTLVTERYGLSDADAARLAIYLQSRAEGNALFLGELLRSLEEVGVLRQADGAWILGALTQTSVPPLLRQVIDGRLARLDDESQRLLAVAAVVGHEVPMRLWAAIGEVDEDVLLDTLERGIEGRLLIELPDGERVQFAHALIRETLYESISVVRRRRLHARVGEALVGMPLPDADAVVYHFRRAGDARLVNWLLKAAEYALHANAEASAIARYEEAIPLLAASDPSPAHYIALYHLAGLHRQQPDGVAYAEEAVKAARSLGDPQLEAVALLRLGTNRTYTESIPDGLVEQERAVAMFAALPEADTHWFTAYCGQFVGVAGFNPSYTRGYLVATLAVVGRFRDAVAYIDSGDRSNNGLLGCMIRDAALGQPDEALASVQQRIARLDAAKDYRNIGVVLAYALAYVMIPYFADNAAEVRRVAKSAIDAYAAVGEESLGLPPQYGGLPALVLHGAWDEAWSVFQVARRYARTVASHVTEVHLARARGEIEFAWALAREMFHAGAATAPGSVPFRRALALQETAVAMSLDTGDLAVAQEWLEAHDRWLAWSGAVLGQSEGQVLWAQYHRQSGDLERARAHAERALVHATEPRQPLALIAAHRLLGELDTEAGRNEGAAAHLDASLQLADACAAPFERALTLLAMAELRAATGEHDRARTLIDTVRTICTPLGAKPALARADALAARLAHE